MLATSEYLRHVGIRRRRNTGLTARPRRRDERPPVRTGAREQAKIASLSKSAHAFLPVAPRAAQLPICALRPCEEKGL